MSGVTPGQRNREGTRGHRLRLAALIVGVALAWPPALMGQYLYESLSVSVGSSGTIYATGITNAGGMQEHSAYVSTVIRSPKGRMASRYTSVSSGGIARADTSLAFDGTDLGNYTASAGGGGNCPVMGDLGSGYASKLLKIGLQQVQFYWDTTQNPAYGCYYAKNCALAPTGSYCGPAFFTTSHNKGTPPNCYIYDSRRFYFVKVGTSLTWWQKGGDLYSDSYWAYPCDAAIP
jgi:hypothetical protein